MKQISLKRLEILEGKTTDNEEMVQAVFFNIVDASRNASGGKEQQVNQWLFPPLVIDRLPGETDSAFSDRAASQARKTMKNQFVVPCLFQVQ